MSAKAALLLLGAGELLDGHAFHALCSHFHVVLVDQSAERSRYPAAVLHLRVDHRDPDAVMRAVDHLRLGRALRGVLTLDDHAADALSVIARRLGLPANSPETVRRCRNKILMRGALTAVGLPVVSSSRVAHVTEAAEAALLMRYPVILRPRPATCSATEVHVDTEEELRLAWRRTVPSMTTCDDGVDPRPVIQGYLDGPRLGVVSVVHDGAVDPAVVVRTSTGSQNSGRGTDHVVAPVQDSATWAELRWMVVSAHEALGLTWGITYTEVRLTKRGVRIIDVNLRPGGECIPLLAKLATGRDLILESATAAAGLPTPGPAEAERPVAAVRFFHPPAHGGAHCSALDLTADVASAAPGLYWFHREPWIDQERGPCARVPQRTRRCFAVVTADSVVDAGRYLDQVQDRVVGRARKPGRELLVDR